MLLAVLLSIGMSVCAGIQKTEVDKIVTNARIYTSDSEHPYAEACAIKDGKFVYVGDKAGLDAYRGETADMGGKFIMPAILDGHVHVPFSVAFDYAPPVIWIEGDGKAECLAEIQRTIAENPGQEQYYFSLPYTALHGEKLTKWDLNPISGDAEVIILESEGHSVWANTKALLKHGVTDDTPDLVPGLSTYERDENGKTTGYMIEMTAASFIAGDTERITDEQIIASLNRFFDFCRQYGVSTVLDAGSPGADDFHERVYQILCDLDKEGKLPITFEGCYIAYSPEQLEHAMENLRRYREIYHTEHVRVNTLKVIADGTIGINTAALLEPYADKPDVYGGCLYDDFDLPALLKEMNQEGFHFHSHTVGERAVKQVLDAVEEVKNEIGDEFRIHVTCAHIEIAREEDLLRFGKLGVMADFSAWWNGGGCGTDAMADMPLKLGEERANNKLRCKTVANGGALVGFSSDNISFGDFVTWNPYLGMELGMTRFPSDKTRLPENEIFNRPYPPADECMTLDEMLMGYTSVNAGILDLPDKGSIAAGKDADYLVFDQDLTAADPIGFSWNEPSEVYFEGVRMK